MALNGHFHTHFYPRLAARVREVRPQILHMDEEPYNLATAQAFWIARRAGAQPLFFTWQNLVRRYPPPFGWMERYCYGAAAGAFAGNGEAVEVLRRKGYRGPAWVVPHASVGVDEGQFYRRPARATPGERGAPLHGGLRGAPAPPEGGPPAGAGGGRPGG